MICLICKHRKMERGTTLLPIERNREILLITDIPAQVCANCGEAYIAEDVARGVQALARKKFSGEISYVAAPDSRQVSVLPYAA